MIRLVFFVCVVSWFTALPAAAQTACAPGEAAKGLQTLFGLTGNEKLEFLSDRIRASGLIDLPVPCQTGARISADVVELFLKGGLLQASGNVVFSDQQGRISADRVEFDVERGTGTFHMASGIMTLGPGANRAEFGNQEPDVFFWGELIEKLDADRYQITEGGFTTCVQPEPRWAIGSNKIVINRHEHALAHNVVFRVKGVPLFYLPVIYYPMGEDERATGILMPTYGNSTLRGSSISNGFFWAINRSQDATFFHDWFQRAGQGMGAEYRYAANGASSGEFRLYRFAQRAQQFADESRSGSLRALTSYDLRGAVVQSLGPSLRARGRVEYTTDIVTQQLYQQNIYVQSNPVRMVEGGVSGAWGPVSASGVYTRAETFTTPTRFVLDGSMPRLTMTVTPSRLFGPVYASLSTEYSNQPSKTIDNGEVQADFSFSRFDLLPAIRVPFTRLTFLTVNTNASYRTTYYDRSSDVRGNVLFTPFIRRYFAVRSDAVGPVLTKLWDTPGNRRIERMKHVIEPTFSVEYLTQIQDADRQPPMRGRWDQVVAGSKRIMYGVANRWMFKPRATGQTPAAAQEFLTINTYQTYYTNEMASLFDSQYAGSVNRSKPVDFSPIGVTARLSPDERFSATGRLEYDVSGLGLQTVGVGGSVGGSAGNVSLTYSRIKADPAPPTAFLTISNRVSTPSGRGTFNYTLNWDVGNSYIVSQTVNASVLAQCCGIQLEYQQYHFPDLVGFPVSADHRFNVGVVLAGLGTFSNFFGAFGGQP